MTRDVDVLVIGAGPAGLAAADAAAAANLEVLLVDENKRVGGQITRLPFIGPRHPMEDLRPGIEFSGLTQCLGFIDQDRVALNRAGAGIAVRPRATLIATGSTERVYPVPGWTKLGVLTAGAGQTFLKGSGVFPYRRVVVAGTGPLLLAAASQLVEAGVEVAAVVDASRPSPAQAASFARMLAGGAILAEGAGYIARLVAARVPIRFGTAVTDVIGERAVEGVKTEKVGRDWLPTGRGQRTIDCDAVLFSQGFSSAIDLTTQAGAALRWNDLMQTWEPVRDASLSTSRPRVWAAGDCAGIGGSKIATAEGRLAGLSIAQELTGTAAGAAELSRMRRRLARLTTFRRGMDEVFRVGDAVHTLAADDTVVCRCQETTAGEIRAAIEVGADSLHSVKLWTRAGMGICQGRTCAPLVDAMASGEATDEAFALRQPPSARFPIRPTSARVLQSLALDDQLSSQITEENAQ